MRALSEEDRFRHKRFITFSERERRINFSFPVDIYRPGFGGDTGKVLPDFLRQQKELRKRGPHALPPHARLEGDSGLLMELSPASRRVREGFWSVIGWPVATC